MRPEHGILGLDIGGTKCAVVLAVAEDLEHAAAPYSGCGTGVGTANAGSGDGSSDGTAGDITASGPIAQTAGPKIRCADGDAAGGMRLRLIARRTFATEAERGFAAIWDDLLDAAGTLLRDRLPAGVSLEAVGVSCGGPLNSRSGMVLSPPNLPGWDQIPLVRLAEEAFGVRAFLQNDANACALVEWKLGAGRGCDDMIFLTMGTGMGAGIIAGGQLLHGACDLAGEVGHIRLDADGPVGFGKAGSFEGFCSGGGIARLTEQRTADWIAAGRAPSWAESAHAGMPEIPGYSAAWLSQKARGGDPSALRLWSEIGHRLGQGLSILIDCLNPQKIVIGSIFARAGELLIPAMEETIRREAIPISAEACLVVAAETGERIGDLASLVSATHGLGWPVTDWRDERSSDD